VSRASLRLLPCFLLVLACAGVPPLPHGVSAAPRVGDPLALLLDKLQHAEGEPAAVELGELRLIALDREPWQTLSPEAAAVHPGRLGVIAGRRCTWWDGVSRQRSERGSWYLLEAGALVAFDHAGFGPACASRPAFEPVASDQVALEHSLMRYLSQRYPVLEVAGEERLARGLRLIERGRSDDARFELNALDRRIAELGRRQDEQETPDADERARLGQEEAALRPLRARLAHALKDPESKEQGQP
jgi:hypothetical protein